ncbi:amino acid adenylation domain-containing protein [Anabaena sp. FACHB-1237]|uniref:amino acid adenylation domain-containing protein n=1 Tax=Anabaena sp. FACHB-1237 TaxID=2692769 RepID=UPI0016809486|nr:amino acid adenylation domain-containing protein [Anabaena sp. FACHB-1237]MBD2136116.1 amino acid adenylation domain-containing protein [Anabaena sp. FACHB-1237]
MSIIDFRQTHPQTTFKKQLEQQFKQRFVCNRLINPPENFIPFSKTEIEQSISQRFVQQVNKYPDAIAIKADQQTLTYEQLNHNANQLANYILQHRGNQLEVIVILLEKGTDYITSILGILKTGKIFVPLDPTFPLDRLTYIIQDSQAVAVITNNQNLSLANQLIHPLINCQCQLLNIDAIDPEISAQNPQINIEPSTPAYIIYTSGSTGNPKGVLQNHRHSLHYSMNDTNTLLISHQDRVIFLYSCSALGGILCIFYTLLNGASLHSFDVKRQGLTNLISWLIDEEITIYHSFTTLFRHFINTLVGTESFPKIRLVKLGGEATSIRDVENYKKYFTTDSILYASLGATETGTFRNFIVDHHTKITHSTVPIGYPVQDMEVILLDDNGQEVPQGKIGEIAVKSPYLALGYWQKPELTKTVFLPDTENHHQRIYRTGDLGYIQPDGCLFHAGRKDFQVKIRGFRIEVTEIEMALLKSGNLQEVVVIASEDINQDKRLIAYIVPKAKLTPTVKELRQFLQQQLPEYMIPAEFVFLEALPLTPNGKLDRKALPQYHRKYQNIELHTFTQVHHSVEQQLIAIWEELLNVRGINLYDDFFELGGNSLLAVRLFAIIEQQFQQKLPLSSLFPDSTISAIAQEIRQQKILTNQKIKNWSSIVKLQPQGTKPPLFLIHSLRGEVLCYRNLALHLGLDQPVYGLQPQGLDGKQPFLVTIEDMARKYLQEMQTIQPQGPYYLAGYSFGGIIAYEIAQQLHQQHQQVAILAIVDTLRPGYSQRLSFIQRLPLHLKNILQQKPDYLWRKLPGWYEHTKYYFQKGYHSLNINHTKYIDLGMINLQAMNQYVFQPYHGQAILFRTKDEERTDSISVKYDPQFGWGEIITGGVNVEYIPGSHISLLNEPYVKVLAHKLKTYL